MNKATFDAMLAQYKKQDISGEGAASWDNGVRCVLPEVLIGGKAEQLTYTGKNLFDVSKVPTSLNITNHGDGSITVIGFESSPGVGTGRTLNNLATGLIAGNTYTLSAKTTCTVRNMIYLSKAKVAWRFGQSMPLTDDMLDSEVYVYADDNGETDTTWNIQIEEGTTATPYEPYTGGVPVPNPNWPTMPEFSSGTEVVSRGNLFMEIPDQTRNGVTLTRLPDGGVYLNGTCTGAFNIEAKGTLRSGVYSLGCRYEGELPVDGNPRVQVYDTVARIGVAVLNRSACDEVSTITFPTLESVRFRVRIEDGHTYNNVKLWPMLVAGEYTAETMPPYTPYFDGGTATAPELLAIPGTEYRDEWNPQTGKGVRRVGKLVLDGTEDWKNPGIITDGFSTFRWIFNQALPKVLAVCTSFPVEVTEYHRKPYSNRLTIYPSTASWQMIFQIANDIVDSNGQTDVSEWKSYLAAQHAAGIPVTVWYALLEPVPFETDPQPLIQPHGTCHIMQTGGSLDAVPITAKYVTHS